MQTYEEWATAYPEAYQALSGILCHLGTPPDTLDPGASEGEVQQRVRLDLAAKGVLSWRNNVGATPASCRKCGFKQQPVRYGLANDSAKLNKRIKSADLILGIPRIICPEHVGSKILQLGSLEVKHHGWTPCYDAHEKAQSAWAALLQHHGGYARFTTGDTDV